MKHRHKTKLIPVIKWPHLNDMCYNEIRLYAGSMDTIISCVYSITIGWAYLNVEREGTIFTLTSSSFFQLSHDLNTLSVNNKRFESLVTMIMNHKF